MLAASLLVLPGTGATPDEGAPVGAKCPQTAEVWDRPRLVLGMKDVPAEVAEGGSYQGAEVLKASRHPVVAFLVVEVEPSDYDKFRGRILEDPLVKYCEEEEIDKLFTTPNDPSFGSQYGPQQIRAGGSAGDAWSTTYGDGDANVCIVDSGVRSTHQDIPAILGQTDLVNGDPVANDDNGHGTHVAGTAAARTNNGLGIAGVAQVGLYAVKVFDSSGSGSTSNVANGIIWCADNTPARTVINYSGGGGFHQLKEDAVDYAYNTKGKLVVAAAGNSGPCTNCIIHPASSAHAVAVTCTTSSSTQCSFSSEGPEAELAAPGNSILSTCYGSDTHYCNLSGTSMSSPHVAGAAALVWSQHTSLTAAQLRSCLTANAQDLGPAGWDSDFGYGEVDAQDSMNNCGGGGGAPANDNFANAFVMASSPYSNSQGTAGATTEAGEPAPCGNMAATVWYRYTPAASGTVTIDTFGSSFDTVLAAYTGGSVGGLTNLACNDDTGGGLQSQVSFAVTGGTTYRIQVGGFSGATGSLSIAMSCSPGNCASTGPANDMFANSFAIGALPYTNSQATTGATTEAGEPAPCGGIGSTVWYRYTSTFSGTLTVDTFGSGFDTVLAVHTGSSVGGLTTLACNDDTAGLQSQVSVAVSAGVTYRIQVGGYQGATGSLVINAAVGTTPQNDCFTGGDAGNTFGTASTISEPVSCSGRLEGTDTRDWYRFNVAVGDTVTVSMTPSAGNDFDLCLYDAAGTAVGCSGAGGSATDSVSVLATAAGQWRAEVYVYSGSGPYTMSVQSCLDLVAVCL